MSTQGIPPDQELGVLTTWLASWTQASLQYMILIKYFSLGQRKEHWDGGVPGRGGGGGPGPGL
jgi:hypothetical protein